MQPKLQWKSDKYYITCACVFVALSIQHAMRMSRMSSLAAPLYSTFPHYPTKDTILEKFIEHKMYVSSLSTTFFILRRTERDVVKNVCWSLCKVRVILV